MMDVKWRHSQCLSPKGRHFAAASRRTVKPQCLCFVCTSRPLALLMMVAYIVMHVFIRVAEERNAAYVREEMLSQLYGNEEHEYRIKMHKHHSVEETALTADFERLDRRIMITGLTRSIEEVKHSVWDTFRSYCDVFNASVHIQTKTSRRNSGSELKNLHLQNCVEVVVKNDDIATEGVEGISNDSWEPLERWGLFRKLGQRVQRITNARQGQLKGIRQYIANHSLDHTLDAIVVVDMDMDSLPTPESLRMAVDYVGLSGKWDAICTDGVDATGWYYDTFATILNFATFVTLPVHPYFRPLIHDANGFTYYYSWLMKRFQISIDKDERQIIPVRSCFGGMAVYRGREYADESCSYRWSSKETDNFKITAWSGKGEVLCEHVRMHLCMEERKRRKKQQFNIGISKALQARWKGQDE